MKKIILSIAATVAMSATMFAQAKFADVAKMEMDLIDQGKIKQASPVPAKFIIINTSKSPIVIEQANPTCGCTISDYTKTPIAPGQTGYINATYNAAGVGFYTKQLHVKLANVDDMKDITLQGTVLSADDYDKWKAENPEKPGIVAAPPVKTAVAKATPSKKASKKPVKKIAKATK